MQRPLHEQAPAANSAACSAAACRVSAASSAVHRSPPSPPAHPSSPLGTPAAPPPAARPAALGSCNGEYTQRLPITWRPGRRARLRMQRLSCEATLCATLCAGLCTPLHSRCIPGAEPPRGGKIVATGAQREAPRQR